MKIFKISTASSMRVYTHGFDLINSFLMNKDYNYFDEEFYSNDYDDTTTSDTSYHVVMSSRTVWPFMHFIGKKFKQLFIS